MDLRSGYYQFRLHPDTRKYFTVKMVMADDVERFFNILSYLWVEPLRVLVLPPCLMLLDDGEEGSWISGRQQGGRFYHCSIAGQGFYRSRLSEGIEALRRAVAEVWTHEAPSERGLWRRLTVLAASRFMIFTHHGLFRAPAAKLEAILGMTRHMLVL
jgi:hypothetical protein